MDDRLGQVASGLDLHQLVVSERHDGRIGLTMRSQSASSRAISDIVTSWSR
jgi:hypothetical protein